VGRRDTAQGRNFPFRRSLPNATVAIGVTTLLFMPLALRAIRLGKRIDAKRGA
jgi:hypothetical protein